MGTVRHVVAFDHLLVGEALAFFADTTGSHGLEEGPAVLVLLLDELGVVVELVVRGANGQERSARELQHGHDGFLEQVHGNVGGLIDDDNVSAGTAGRLGISPTDHTTKKTKDARSREKGEEKVSGKRGHILKSSINLRGMHGPSVAASPKADTSK